MMMLTVETKVVEHKMIVVTKGPQRVCIEITGTVEAYSIVIELLNAAMKALPDYPNLLGVKTQLHLQTVELSRLIANIMKEKQQ